MADNKIKFSIHPNPLKDSQGCTTYQVRQDTMGTMDTKTLEQHLAGHHLLAGIPLSAVVETIQRELVEQLGFNRRLHLNGLGSFSLTIGLKPVVDADGTEHKRIVTDPAEITGNDIEVTGISFVPDKELLALAKRKLTYFEHTAPRGTTGHSDAYTEEEMRRQLLDWFAENEYLTRPLMSKVWHLTEYRAKKWLRHFSTGADSLLVLRKQAGTFFYYLNRSSE